MDVQDAPMEGPQIKEIPTHLKFRQEHIERMQDHHQGIWRGSGYDAPPLNELREIFDVDPLAFLYWHGVIKNKQGDRCPVKAKNGRDCNGHLMYQDSVENLNHCWRCSDKTGSNSSCGRKSHSIFKDTFLQDARISPTETMLLSLLLVYRHSQQANIDFNRSQSEYSDYLG